MLMKAPVLLTGRLAYFGVPEVSVELPLFVSVDSLHGFVTGERVIAPVVPEFVFTHRRSRACLTSAAVVPAGRVSALNCRNPRIDPVLLLPTRRSVFAP